jgi:hypothetical protein
VLGRALAIAEAHDLTLQLQLARVLFGYMRGLQGYADESCETVEQSLKVLRGMVNGVAVGYVLWGAEVGGTLVLAGRHDDGIALAEDVIALAQRMTAVASEAWALQLLGDAMAAKGDGGWGARAAGSYRDALALADELSVRPLAAHCHAGLARLSRKTGTRADTEKHFAMATAMYREMGMTYWLQKLAKETGAVA